MSITSRHVFVKNVVRYFIPSNTVSGHGEAMVAATQAQQQLMETGVGVGVEGGAGVEMMVMDSLDPTLLQMKTEVSSLFRALCLI